MNPGFVTFINSIADSIIFADDIQVGNASDNTGDISFEAKVTVKQNGDVQVGTDIEPITILSG